MAHIENLLRPEAKKAIEAHLDECRQCREEVSQMMHLHNRLTVDGKSYTVSDFENSVFERIFQKQTFEPAGSEEHSNIEEEVIFEEPVNIDEGANLDEMPELDRLSNIEELSKMENAPRIDEPKVRYEREKRETVNYTMILRRIFMNARVIKIAAAAVIIVGVFLGANIFFNQGTALAWDEVFSRVEQVVSVTYRMRMSMYGIALAPGGNLETESYVKLSTELGLQLDTYMDGILKVQTYALLPEEAMVSVIPEAKKYMYIQFTPEIFAKMREDNGDPKQMIDMFKEYEYTELGGNTLEGVEVEGIESRDPGFAEGVLGDVVARLWVEVETGWPYKMTIEARGDDDELQLQMIMDNFEWGTEFEASEFEADIPNDYEELANIDMATLETGEAAVEGFRVYAELSGGIYPSDLTMPDFVQELSELLDAKKKDGTLPDQPEKEMINGLVNLNMIGPFFGGLGAEGMDPMYYGATVTAEDTDKVLFRWKTEDGNYRVIFGDLSILDVTAERLKELESR